ncbi:MAG: class I SAM-dependent methyltransferase [Gammaproteobacteria bacterium]|nr:class I SAM-dependent methyltransferase [Gammaproteobacteria bacterium]
MKVNEWRESWSDHFETYVTAPPRAGYFIDSLALNNIQNVLEVASGSARDSMCLEKRNYKCTAVDYEEQLINRLIKDYGNTGVEFRQADAFSLPFKSNSYDLVFHNGFFVLFQDNNEIIRLFKEQARVASCYVLIIVHNSLNVLLSKKFHSKMSHDPIYDIRFFKPMEIEDLILKSNEPIRSIKFLKFGGVVDRLYYEKIKRLPNPLVRLSPYLVPHLYRMLPWHSVERVACLVELAK